MLSLKGTVLLAFLSAAHAANFYDKRPFQLKRQADTYAYPLPIITFQENPKKTLVAVETIKSVPTGNSGARYLPPNPSAPAAPKSPPISVSFNGYDAPAPSKPAASASTAATSAPAAPSAPAVVVAPVSAAPAPTTTTVVKKRPSGGLGGFKYYGGSGSSSSSSSDSTAASVAASPAVQQVQPVQEKPVQKPLGKIAGYDYPSPKSNRKPTKKEQKLADSKPEESAQGYHYDVGPGALAAGGALAGGVQTFSAGGSSGGMMGLSYMRQSSPFYSYHVMLD